MKKLLDLLAIILPALIVALGIVRLFVKRTKGVNGLTLFFAILLLLIGLINYFIFPSSLSSRKKKEIHDRIEVSTHSAMFNKTMAKTMSAYFTLSDALAASDLTGITTATQALRLSLDSLSITELQKDTLIYVTALPPFNNMKTEADMLVKTNEIIAQRNRFNVLSNEMFTFISTIRYDQTKFYWVECANAFGEGNIGNWLAKEEESNNPYGITDCAEVKTVLNYAPIDTTKSIK